jgi:hypothetical protein
MFITASDASSQIRVGAPQVGAQNNNVTHDNDGQNDDDARNNDANRAGQTGRVCLEILIL